ncbi:MAG: sugar ABC transporter permease, partial [Elioraea tepidiphila]
MAADGTIAVRDAAEITGGRANSLQRFARRRSTIAFVMTLPLLAVIVGLVAYPALFGIYLSMLNRRMTEFVGFLNYEILIESETFWNVFFQSCFFAI